jgi:ERCC4-type nuclease
MKPKEPIKLIVDVHESDSGILEDLKERNLGDCSMESLDIGDIEIRFGGHSVLAEIKRNQDFTNSLHSGRLSEQIWWMLNSSLGFPLLIIEGWSPYVTDSTNESDLQKQVDMHRKSIRTLNRRIAVFETKDQNDTCDLLESIIKDIANKKFFHVQRKVILVDDTDDQIVMLSSLPNISVARAQELLEIFGSPENALNHIAEWIEISGITESRLQKIKDVYSKEVQR